MNGGCCWTFDVTHSISWFEFEHNVVVDSFGLEQGQCHGRLFNAAKLYIIRILWIYEPTYVRWRSDNTYLTSRMLYACYLSCAENFWVASLLIFPFSFTFNLFFYAQDVIWKKYENVCLSTCTFHSVPFIILGFGLWSMCTESDDTFYTIWLSCQKKKKNIKNCNLYQAQALRCEDTR